MTNATLDFYRKYYDLPELVYEEDVPSDFFKCVKEKHDFIVLVVLNEHKDFLLIRDLNKNIGWELPGGYVDEGETISSAVNRISINEIGLEIDEFFPVVLVKNIFKCGGNTIEHNGIAFVTLVRGIAKPKTTNLQSIFTKLIPGKSAYQNLQIIKFAEKKICDNLLLPPYNEIESAKKHQFLFLLHRIVVKQIGSLSSKKIIRKIMNLVVGSPVSVLDASCGECSLIFDLKKRFKPETVVANDISWRIISLMKHRSKSVIFTNHNVLNFPFKHKFELIIFKNTLHHIDIGMHDSLLKLLITNSKQLIIMDIDDPTHGNFKAKLWNKYYRSVLGDQGGDFLNYGKFKELVTRCAGENKNVSVGSVETIKGNYFYASILDK